MQYTYLYIWLILRGASKKQECKETWPTLQPWFHGDGVHLWVVVQGTLFHGGLGLGETGTLRVTRIWRWTTRLGRDRRVKKVICVYCFLDHFWEDKKTKPFPKWAKNSFQRGKFGSVTLWMWSNFWISRSIHVQKRVFKGYFQSSKIGLHTIDRWLHLVA